MIALQDLAPAASPGGSLGGVFPTDVDERFVRPFLQAYRMQVQAGIVVLLVALAIGGVAVWVLRRTGRVPRGRSSLLALASIAALATGMFFDASVIVGAAARLGDVVATEPAPPPLRAFVREVRRRIPDDADVLCVLGTDPRAYLAPGGGGGGGGEPARVETSGRAGGAAGGTGASGRGAPGGGTRAGPPPPIALLEANHFLYPRRLWLDSTYSFGSPDAVPREWLRRRSIGWLLIVRSYADFECVRVSGERRQGTGGGR